MGSGSDAVELSNGSKGNSKSTTSDVTASSQTRKGSPKEPNGRVLNNRDDSNDRANAKGSFSSKTKKADEPLSDDPLFSIPKKISIGKSSATASPLGMVLAFGLFVAASLCATHQISSMLGIGRPRTKPHERILTSTTKRSGARRELIKRALLDPILELLVREDPRLLDPAARAQPCGIYLAASSIPEAGWGWFAGKDYTTGDVIRRERGASAPVLLLKPHSVLANVEWTNDDSQGFVTLATTRNITRGEEFFVSWEDFHRASNHGGHLMPDLPTPPDFARADGFVREARERFFGSIDYTQLDADAPAKKRHATSNARWNQARRKRQQNLLKPLLKERPYQATDEPSIDRGLELWKTTLERYEPRAARLLPSTAEALSWYHRHAAADESLVSASTLYGVLRNQTLASLAKHGHCASRIEWRNLSVETKAPTEASCASEKEESCAPSKKSFRQVINQRITEGGLVGVVPLGMRAAEDSLPPWCASVSGRSVCPLDGGIHERSRDQNRANVAYRWSQTAEELLSSLSAPSQEADPNDRLLQNATRSLWSWDLVALRDLRPNETVVLYQPPGDALALPRIEDTDEIDGEESG